MSKATLKFKLNEVEEMTPLDQLDQLDQLEQLIRTSSIEPIIKVSDNNQGSDPILNMDLGSDPAFAPMTNKKTKQNWYKVVSSVSAAIVIGLLLGLTIISMFVPSAGQSAISNTKTTVAQPAVAASDYVLVQVGVFSTTQGAKQTLQHLQELGFSAVIDASTPMKQRVIAGLAANREKAMLLSRLLQAKQVTSYVSPMTLSARQSTKGVAFFTASNAFNQAILTPLGQQMTTPSSKSLTTKLIVDLKHKHTTWVSAARAIQSNMTEPIRLGINTISNEQLRLIATLESYLQNGQSAPLWQAQSSLIRILLTEQRLREFY